MSTSKVEERGKKREREREWQCYVSLVDIRLAYSFQGLKVTKKVFQQIHVN